MATDWNKDVPTDQTKVKTELSEAIRKNWAALETLLGKAVLEAGAGLDVDKLDGKHAADLKHGVNGDDETAIKVKIGSFTCPTATGNYSVTGVGFKPRFVRFRTSQSHTTATTQSWSEMDYNGNQYAMYQSDDGSGKGCDWVTNLCLYLRTGGGTDRMKAVYVSMNNDGFTINFTDVTGGTANVIFWEAVR